MNRYVAGFMFNSGLTQVALIRKNKPAWQAGKLNGIGGSLEAGESGADAMVREFHEETGVLTEKEAWSHYLTMDGENDDDGGLFEVQFFCRRGELEYLDSPTDEAVKVIELSSINVGRSDMIENLVWLIAMAVDHLQDGRPTFTYTRYLNERGKAVAA